MCECVCVRLITRCIHSDRRAHRIGYYPHLNRHWPCVRTCLLAKHRREASHHRTRTGCMRYTIHTHARRIHTVVARCDMDKMWLACSLLYPARVYIGVPYATCCLCASVRCCVPLCCLRSHSRRALSTRARIKVSERNHSTSQSEVAQRT